MRIISVQNLQKTYQTKVKQAGLKASVQALLRPTYQEVEAVNNISFDVEQGEILAFIGPNGAGKSTTIKMLTGILTPTSGQVRVMDLDPIKQRKSLAYKIGTVFGQKSQLWFHLPPYDSFMLLGKIYEIEHGKLIQRINQLVDTFDIESLMQTPVRKLSLGQRIRCEIAASLLHEPSVIFLDEPTIGLDVVVKQKIRELILKINREQKTTIFLTSHDAGDIELLCKRAIVINHGEIVLDEPMKNLKYNYLNKKVISVKYETAIDNVTGPFNVLKHKGGSLKVEVDTLNRDLDEVLKILIGFGRVIDINIEEAPLEEIIAMIYQRQKGGKPS